MPARLQEKYRTQVVASPSLPDRGNHKECGGTARELQSKPFSCVAKQEINADHEDDG